MSKSRLEAFSDGVLAVAITLLVLNISVPHSDPRHARTLAHELGRNWPDYVAYATSFITIGIIWINHHAMIGRLREVDHSILFLNLVLLMSIGVIPFATDLLATYLRHDAGDAEAAATVYGGTFLVMALLFSVLNRHILLSRAHLLRDAPSLSRRRTTFKRATAGVLPYLLATALAPVSAYATLVICGLVACFYAFPFASDAGGTE